MTDAVHRTIARFCQLRFGSRLGVAVSGGADSVFLLHVLHELGLSAAVLHVNHHLRGGESDIDAAFVANLARILSLPFFQLDASPTPGNLEQEARRARMDFFQSIIASNHVDAVATGHTQDDQAETVLYRFLRGAGSAGLSGIRPWTSDKIIRPLLDLRRADIRAWLHSRGIAWREDSSNLDPSFVRNRIRLEMIPGIEALTGDSLSTLLSSTAERAQAEEEFWELELPRRAEGKLRLDRDACIFNVMPFLAEPLAVQRRLLRLAAAEVKGNLRGLDFSHIEALRALFTPGDGSARTQVPGLDAIRSFEWVRLTRLSERPEPRNVQVQMSVPGRTLLPELDIVIHLELLSPQAVYNKRVSALDLDRCNGPLILRNWRPGDQLRTAGKSSFDKVKTLFQEQRVPIWERRGWPVVACGDDVVWARQFGVSADFAASNHSPNAALIAEHFQVTESKRGFAASIELKRASGTGEPDAEVL